MDATERWETEALRTSQRGRPRPSRARRAPSPSSNWVTLKEAESATGIPTNTLRKWVRKDTIPSYLESEGEFVLRMVDLDAVQARAKKLGRRVEPGSRVPGPESRIQGPGRPVTDGAPKELHVELDALERSDPAAGTPDSQFPEDPAPADAPPDTMIVPVDAWNKMLAQLGNLHEAGQQLAEARERAAKAETEAEFLRERLADLRQAPDTGHQSPDRGSDVSDATPGQEPEPPPASNPTAEPETTSYWRYLTTGWRDRRRRSR